jgi:hypothetical protein
MTLLYFEGYETCADDTDVLNRGWDLDQTAALSGQNVLPMPSRNGISGGIGLMLRGPYNAAGITYAPNAGEPGFGMYDTKQSIYSLWQAGGFSVGFNATFNKTIQLQVGAFAPQQIRYDGSTYYWAIAQLGSTYIVVYSSDLQNWTQTASQPANIGQFATITIIGSGATATILVSSSATNAAATIAYTSNLGLTWTNTAAIGNQPKYPVATGNSAAPYILPYSTGTGAGVGFLSSAFAFTAIGSTILSTTLAQWAGAAKVVAGVVMTWMAGAASAISTPGSGATQYFAWAQANNASITSTSAWTTCATLPACVITDMTYINGYWIAVGYGGIYVAAQSGTSGNVLGPAATTAWSNVYSSGTATIYSVEVNAAGTLAVAVGHDAVTNTSAIYTSTNGTVWTKVDRFLFNEPSAIQNNTFTNVYWDGHRFVLVGGINNNVIAVSTDGFSWNALYYPDYTETAGTTSCNLAGVYSGTLTAGTYVDQGSGAANPGTFVPWSVATTAGFASGLGVTVGAATQGINVVTRTVQGVTLAGATAGMTQTAVTNAAQTVPCSGSLTNYYEIIATAVPGTTNMFNVQYAINGVILPGSQSNVQFAATTDTTGASHLLLNNPNTGNFVMMDDIYLTNFAGTLCVGQLGPQIVMPLNLASDVSDQFTNSIPANHNYQTVGTPLSNSEGYVYSSTPGVKDVYGTSNAVPTNYKINGVMVEGFFAAYGPIGANCQIEASSNGVVAAGNTVAANTATPLYSSVLMPTDPNTSAAWTSGGLNALQVIPAKLN